MLKIFLKQSIPKFATDAVGKKIKHLMLLFNLDRTPMNLLPPKHGLDKLNFQNS